MAGYAGTALTTERGRGADFRSHGFSWDIKPQPDGSFSQEQLAGLLWDLRFEPDWRRQAEVEYSYYDGEQLTQATLQRMRDNGIPPVIINMIAPAIDAVTGFETFIRSDPRVMPEADEFYETAEGLNIKMKEMLRLTEFNDAIGDAFKDSIIIGIGWVEVTRNPDPFGYPYIVRRVPWREMYWDYRSRNHDILSDARFLARRKWFDVDILIHYFPAHEEAIRRSAGGYPHGWLNDWEDIAYDDVAANFAHTLEQEQRFTLEADEYRQQTRGRVPLYEIIYKVPRRVVVLRMRDGAVIEFIPENPFHLRAIESGMAVVRRGVTEGWRQAWYSGDQKLGDIALRSNRPHYIPFVCFRRDADGAVYGLTRRQKSPQEAINARHSRILWELASNRFAVDEDAVDDHDETAKELNRNNAYIVLKSDRLGEKGIESLGGLETSAATMQMLQESKADIFGVTGLYPEFQGRNAHQGEQSGISSQIKIEQTQQVLGTPIRNYRKSKRHCAELALDYIIRDIGEFSNYEVERDGEDRNIVLNARKKEGGPRTNDVLMARVKVAVGEIPESVTYQQQKFQTIAEVVKSLPEQMQMQMMDLVVRAAVLPEADEILERIREITGFGPEPKDPEKRRALMEQQQKQQELQEFMQQIEMRIAAAEGAVKEATAVAAMAKAEKMAGVDTDMTDAQTGLAEAQTQAELAAIRQKDEELRIKEVTAEGQLKAAAAQLENAALSAQRQEAQKASSGPQKRGKPKGKSKKSKS